MRRLKGAIIVLIDILQVPRNLIFCLAHGLRLDSTWRLYGLPWIRRGGHGSILTIGRRFKACSRIGRNSLGIFQPVIIRTVSHGAHLEIGDDVGVSGCTISAAERIVIGNRVLIGSGALITDSDAHAINPEIRLKKGVGGLARPVIIEDDVFIGARAIVLKGVTIGRGSVVGAGAVVSRNVPPYSIVAGNPIKIIGDSRKAER